MYKKNNSKTKEVQEASRFSLVLLVTIPVKTRNLIVAGFCVA